MRLAREAYLIAKKLPYEEKFALSDQLRRSAVSIPSNTRYLRLIPSP
ncbi:MAG: four helix bundle protein [Megasphaera sp.]|nr:four helix bundle protein [Megasphaera sp.]